MQIPSGVGSHHINAQHAVHLPQGISDKGRLDVLAVVDLKRQVDAPLAARLCLRLVLVRPDLHPA